VGVSEAGNEAVGEQLGRSRLEAFEAIAENSPDLIFRFDRQLRHVYVNPAAERQMRRPRHAIRGRTQRELGMVEATAREWEESLERVFRSGSARRFEFTLGSTWLDVQEHFEAFATPERGARGEIETVLVIVRDTTEQVRAQRALAAREASLRTAQRIAGCGSFTWEPATDLLHGSEELHRLLPLPYDEPATLAALLALVHEEDRRRVRRALEDAWQARRGWSMQFRALCRDGGERVLHSRGEVAVGDGGVVCLHGTALDVTEQEDVQSAVRQLLSFARFAVERIDDAVMWIDAGGRIVSVNHAAGVRFGERTDSLVGQPVERLELEDPAASWAERWAELRRSGRLTYEIALPSGGSMRVSAHHAALHGHEYACLVVASERRAAATRTTAALPDAAPSHLLAEEELEIRAVGQLRALAAQS
jgi:PAS domain S-box-containing protein